MTDEPGRRQGLGRGLSALLGDDAEDYAALDSARGGRELPIEHLRPGRFQPRHRFDSEQAKALVASVRERGILQPILVRRLAAGEDGGVAYEIVAGERRWRAAQEAQLHQVPVIIKDLSDTEALEVALIENLQREDLSPLEEAEGYRRMIEDFGHTQERLAQTIGRSRSHLANMLRLLTLPEAVKAMLDDGRLSAGHARTLVGLDNAEKLAKRIVSGGLNVRQAERLAKGGGGRGGGPGKDADIVALEGDISAAVGLPVTIHHKGEGGGEVRVSYTTLEQLDEICRRLART
ncbi:MAG: ParB/RepB/Spo0J family partition protein [Proteobacteria bacterium]|nr:ParB/RepB/Spo0J family partition protein [Pseudomonadota bacterium]MDA1132742.1 ParB/RepB/Spo0J family partition protein [Pseudomonadota bacterium]